MLKKVFVLVMSMFMTIVFLTPIGSTQIKANDVETYGVVNPGVMREQTKYYSYTVSYNGYTRTLQLPVTLEYTVTTVDGVNSYSGFYATVGQASNNEFYTVKKGNPDMDIYLSSNKVIVTGEVNIYYNEGLVKDVLVKTDTYTLTFYLS